MTLIAMQLAVGALCGDHGEGNITYNTGSKKKNVKKKYQRKCDYSFMLFVYTENRDF